MRFVIVSRTSSSYSSSKNCVVLKIDYWNDFSFQTLFNMTYRDEADVIHDFGHVKIGFIGQTINKSTYSLLGEDFEQLDERFFSLGQDIDYYKKMANLPTVTRNNILIGIRDIVANPDIIGIIKDESVFGVSLLRGISLSQIKGQFLRVLLGSAEQSNFSFQFERSSTDDLAEIDLDFEVRVDSRPTSNLHAIIGRNGVGKTTLLNGMIEAITSPRESVRFVDMSCNEPEVISNDYFSSLVSVSFSAFDPFNPPKEQSDPAKGTCYYYIGLKDPQDYTRNRSITELQRECSDSLIACFLNQRKTSRWIDAIKDLGSDDIFDSMGLSLLEEDYRSLRNKHRQVEQSDSKEFKDAYFNLISTKLKRMSSGHAIVLLTITRLVATVEEKTIVLMDEPESHLHPPLIAAFLRAVSNLIDNRNGVAIIATHSPVVLQEIPKTCVWKIHRNRRMISASRPTIESFGENVGTLTSEVFGLEVERSGFHYLLNSSVREGGSYEQILKSYEFKLGFEGRAVLASLIADRDKKAKQ